MFTHSDFSLLKFGPKDHQVRADQKCGVYLIKNLLTMQFYVGVSTDLARRKSDHFRALIRGIHDNSKLQRSFDKYGALNFEFQIVCDNMQTLGLARLIEQAILTGISKDTLFNQAKISNSVSLLKHSDEVKLKIREASLNYWKSRSVSEMQQHAEASRKRATGRVFSKESRLKMRVAKLGNAPWNKGISTKKESHVI